MKERHAALELDRAALAEIGRELGALDADPNRLRLCVRRALTWINDARNWQDWSRRSDRTRPTAAGRRRLAKALAQGILQFRDAQPNHKLTDLRDLLNVPGVDEALLRDLAYTGCQLLPQPFRPTLGVLLPVRLETRFYPPATAGQGWKLRLRIVPDHASIDRHDPLATVMELDDVERMWQQAEGDLNTKTGKAAWRAFMSVHRPHRAAWAGAHLPPLTARRRWGRFTSPGPAQMSQDTRPSRLRGLPSRLEVWSARAATHRPWLRY